MNNGGYFKYMEGDIASIVSETLRSGSTGALTGQFEIHEPTQTVRTIFTGKCAFRYGIEQHVNVDQEKLHEVSPGKSNDPPTQPPRYRPLFPTTNIH